jgi:hypothetical protein
MTFQIVNGAEDNGLIKLSENNNANHDEDDDLFPMSCCDYSKVYSVESNDSVSEGNKNVGTPYNR